MLSGKYNKNWQKVNSYNFFLKQLTIKFHFVIIVYKIEGLNRSKSTLHQKMSFRQ